MKKILLALLVVIGLQTQAQVSYCDSLSYSVVPGSQTLIATGNASPLLNLADSVVWSWSACNSSTCYTGSGNPATFASILTTDTVKLCYDAFIYFDTMTYICTDCDSLVYDGFAYSWMLMNMGNPTAITELELNTNNDGKMYDLLGREVIEAQIGVMYIRNNKKYIRIR